MIFPYSAKAFDITQDDKYVKIGFRGNVQRASKIESLYLNKDEVEALISELTKIKGKLS
jgi:hypothetical protein